LSNPAANTYRYSFEGAPTLEEFNQSNAFIRGLVGPLGAGKSSACVFEMIDRSLIQRRSPDGRRKTRWGVIRQTYRELRDTTIRTVFQWLPPQHFGRYYESKHSYQIQAFDGCDIEMLFLALERPEDVKKLLSLELTGGWINEGREVPWAIFEALQGRIGRYPAMVDNGPSWFGMWSDTNPPDSDSRWYDFFEQEGWLKDFRRLQRDGHLPSTMSPDDYVGYFKQPSGLSPGAENLANLPGGPRYYANLIAGKSDEWVKIYVHGQYGFLLEGKLVYPEYIDRVHCQEVDPIEGPTILRLWDFGLTPCCVFAQNLPDGRFLVFDEMTSDNMSIDQFSDNVLNHCARNFRGEVQFEDWGDPAGKQRAQTDSRTCFEIMHAKGIMVDGAPQDPQLRQESVRWALRQLHPDGSLFVVHPRCKVVRKGFLGGYHRRRLSTVGAERYSDQPEKNVYSHPHDCVQYGCAKYFGPLLTRNFETVEEDLGLGDGNDANFVDPSRSDVTGY
jgi:hypothetical protein